ncbi:DASS family sodium-coupled anion symporter [Pandoraea sp. ISTKB]|uniref:DASS family sodium-coupled anion symporter n=1 Tax=Pandoraea sp. ISTKB TaxID=1586708 RepID=UPI000847BF51|nr:DASS family sodium-coupled anion symporter [Pandoraea sp. ISTKB]ODP31815.1 Anion transporter [Pandoraea sp. ISTKB]
MNQLAGTVARQWAMSARDAWILLANLVLMVTLIVVLPFEDKTNRGLALAVFIAVLWLSEAVHLTATALMVPVLAVMLGILDTPAALGSFAHPIVFLFFGGFALATAMRIQGLDRFLANWLLHLAGGHMGRAALMLFGATALLSMWVNNTSTTSMMLPLALGILSQLDASRDRKTVTFLLLGIAYSANIGGLGTVVGSVPNAMVATHLGIDFLTWAKFGVPLVAVLLPLMIATTWLVLRPRLDQTVDIETEPMTWTGQRIAAVGIFGFTVLSWIFSQHISAWLGDVKQLDTLIALLAAILIATTGVASWKQIQAHTDWGVLLLFGGGLTLSVVLRDSGASVVMAQGVSSVFATSPVLVILLITAAFIVFLTELTSNTASAAILVPIFAAISLSLGLPEALLTMVIGIGASCAFMLPVATPPNAIVFGTGSVPQSQMVRAGLGINLVCILVITAFAWFLWR